jgi:hypothetical protein
VEARVTSIDERKRQYMYFRTSKASSKLSTGVEVGMKALVDPGRVEDGARVRDREGEVGFLSVAPRPVRHANLRQHTSAYVSIRART